MSDDQKKPTSEELIQRAKERYEDPGDKPVSPFDGADESVEHEDIGAGTPIATVPEPPPAREPVSEEPHRSFPVPDEMGMPPEQPPQRSGFGNLLRLPISWIFIGLFVAGGLIVNWFTDAKRDESGAVVEAGDVAADQIRVGDCLAFPAGFDPAETFEFEQIEAVPCSEPHWAEVYAEYTMSGSSYPGVVAIEDFVFEHCRPSYHTFTGVVYEDEATMDITWFEPTSQSWSQGDRTVQCAVVDLSGGDLVGTMEGRGVLAGGG